MPLFPWAFLHKLIHDASWPISCEAVQEEGFHLRQQQSRAKLDCLTMQTNSRSRVLNKEQK